MANDLNSASVRRDPFIIIRPSGLPFEQEILTGLKEFGFLVCPVGIINDWTSFARQLYHDKFGDKGGVYLQPGAEAWLAGSAILFGNRAKVFPVYLDVEKKDVGGIIPTLQKLLQFKAHFRAERKCQKDRVKIFCERDKQWHPVFFDYIHTTDSDQDRLDREWSWLFTEGKIVFE